MSRAQAQIIDAFEGLRRLLCDSGMFVDGNPLRGIWILYWGNGRLRSLIEFQNGCREGLSVNFHTSGSISSFCYYRAGRKWGETGVMTKDGRYLKHVLIGEYGELEYSESLKYQFDGFYMTREDHLIHRKYVIDWRKLL